MERADLLNEKGRLTSTTVSNARVTSPRHSRTPRRRASPSVDAQPFPMLSAIAHLSDTNTIAGGTMDMTNAARAGRQRMRRIHQHASSPDHRQQFPMLSAIAAMSDITSATTASSSSSSWVALPHERRKSSQLKSPDVSPTSSPTHSTNSSPPRVSPRRGRPERKATNRKLQASSLELPMISSLSSSSSSLSLSSSLSMSSSPLLSFPASLSRSIPIPPIFSSAVMLDLVNADTGEIQQSLFEWNHEELTFLITSETRSPTTTQISYPIGAVDRIERGPDVTAPTSRRGADTTNAIKHCILNYTVGLILRPYLRFVSRTSNQDGDDHEDDYILGHPRRSGEIWPERHSFSTILSLSDGRTLKMLHRNRHERNQMIEAFTEIREAFQTAVTNVFRVNHQAEIQLPSEMMLLRYAILPSIPGPKLEILMNCINFPMKNARLQEAYRQVQFLECYRGHQRRNKGLTFEQCWALVHKLKHETWGVRPVDVLWKALFGEFMKNGKPRMHLSDKTFLEKFLHLKQGEMRKTREDVRRLFAQLRRLPMPFTSTADVALEDPRRIDKDRFEAYLYSRDNDAFDPQRERHNPTSMRQPISEYWINSSHNTYLTGDQLMSHSSVEMYSNALSRGCRCLELDIWDGKQNCRDSAPDPVVRRGHTITRQILFKDIIKTIKVFLSSNPDTFPIILSFENHCSIPYQEVMAEQLVEILGDSLYIPADGSLSGRLPSPEELKGMVAINEVCAPRHVAPSLARLTLLHGTKFKDWDSSVQNPTHHMHSFSENKLKASVKNSKSRKWAIYNQSHMTRTCPGGSRVNSSNYNPTLAWSVGCQMVALNFQSKDAFLRLNDGRFRENGNCGYVLKPSFLMIRDDFSSTTPPVKLSIRILSGSCLPKPKGRRFGDCIRPYVKVSVFDVKHDKESCTSYTTGVVQNGFCPNFYHENEEFSFVVEQRPVAMLQLTVYNSTIALADEFVASASIPISCLREGLRSVKLFDAKNTRNGLFGFASLLVDIKLQRSTTEI